MKLPSFLTLATLMAALPLAVAVAAEPLKVGIIGLDTSHVIAFTNTMNKPGPTSEAINCRVVAAYPKGSPDIESSTKRVPGYIADIKKLDVERSEERRVGKEGR